MTTRRDELIGHATHNRLRGAIVIVPLAAIVIASSALMAAARESAPNVAKPEALAMEATDHHLRSGLVTVSDGYLVKFSAINSYDTDQEITLTLRDANGKAVKSTTGIVGPDKSLTLGFDPPAPIRLRAELMVIADAGFLCNGFAPTLELATKDSAGVKPILVVDEFWHEEPLAV